MDNTERLINIYHTGFIVCAILLLVGIALAVLFFFMFDIRNVYMIRTGRAKQKTIEEMQARNLKTGKLSTNAPYTDSGELRKKDEKRKTGAFKTGAFRLPERRKATVEPPKESPKQPQPAPASSPGETVLLSETPAGADAAASAVKSAVNPNIDPLATEVLSTEKQAAEPAASKTGFRFTITERTVIIHTSESI